MQSKSTKKKVNKKSTSLVKTSNKQSENQVTAKKSSNLNTIEIQKFNDAQGTSYRNKDEIQNYRTSKNTIDKTSKYGVNPAVFYDSNVDYKKPHDEIIVVKEYDPNYLPKAHKNAEQKAKILTKQAINEYNDEVTRARLVTKKNMTIAKVEALRVLTKAMVIEKNFHEKENEVLRHKQAIKNINDLRAQLLERNEVDLQYNLEKLARDNEIELKNNEDDYIRTKIQIEQKSEIIGLKIQNEKEKIRALSRGEAHRKQDIKSDIKRIKFNKHIPNDVNLDSSDDSIQQLVKKIKAIDPKTLSKEERDSVSKFLRLVDSYDAQDKHEELLDNYKVALENMDDKIEDTMRKASKNKKGKHFMITTYDSYKKVVDAKKETLFISEPVVLHETPEVRTKVIKMKAPVKMSNPNSRTLVKIKPQSVKLEKMQPQRMDLSDMYFDKDIQKTIAKFKRIVANAVTADDFMVSKFGNNAYKIKFEKMTYTKYEIRWGRKKHKHDEETESPSYDVEYKDLNELEEKESWWSKLFTKKVNDYGEPAPRGISTLRRKIEKLPEDPIVIENNGIFRQERTDLMKAIEELKALEVSKNWSQQEVDETLARVNAILDEYDALVKADLEYRKNINRAQNCDERLARYIEKTDHQIATSYANADLRFTQREQWIQEKYLKNTENAKNQALLNIERIYEQEQENLAKEEQQHLWNKASSYENNNKLANNQYKYQNALISATVKEIERYNKKAEKPILLNDLPYKILNLPVTSSAQLNINVIKNGDKLVAVASSNESNKESFGAVVNEEIPQNVQKIYVLDKFRNVKDVKTRVALLNEYANITYDKAIQYNQQREKAEIDKADKKLKEKLKEVDAIYSDSNKIATIATRMEGMVRERNMIHDNYKQIKSQKWKVHDRDEKYKEKIARIQENQELELLKAQRENDRNKSQKVKLLSSKEIDVDDVIGKKSSKK